MNTDITRLTDDELKQLAEWANSVSDSKRRIVERKSAIEDAKKRIKDRREFIPKSTNVTEPIRVSF